VVGVESGLGSDRSDYLRVSVSVECLLTGNWSHSSQWRLSAVCSH